ncbi:hypothetical protein F443_07552 [Phytophthora nicotianae P1569]|uniref:Uncharacterized protein n=1 Tax=Phytophthora nicotianae P1569 TaxID=1317065 RepID=V9FDF0_PHYNI|nr:hypothetical protein F443_07552 [Phytophthora nicotianae P1569]
MSTVSAARRSGNAWLAVTERERAVLLSKPTKSRQRRLKDDACCRCGQTTNRFSTGILPVLPPKLEYISHEALVKWTKDRRDYETKLHNRCRVTGKEQDAVVEQIRGSFDADLLDVFCELQLSSIKNKVLPVKELMKSDHKINLTESDVNTRVIDYFKCFKTIVADNGLVECFGGERGTREKSKRLISALRPSAIKTEVKQRIRYTHPQAEKDPKRRETTGRKNKSKTKLPQKAKSKQEAPAVNMTARTRPTLDPTQGSKHQARLSHHQGHVRSAKRCTGWVNAQRRARPRRKSC